MTSHYFEVLPFVCYTNRTLQKIPTTQGDLHFWTTKQFLSPNLSVSKNSNFLLLGLTSRKYTKGERMAKLWPSESHFIVSGWAAPREKPLLESLPADLKRTEKQLVSPTDTAQKDMAITKKPTMNIKPAVGVQVLKPCRWCATQAQKADKISALTTWTQTRVRLLSWLLNLRKILYMCCAARAQHTPEQPRLFQLCCMPCNSIH